MVWGWGGFLLPGMMCVRIGALEPTVPDPVATSQGTLALPHHTGALAGGFPEDRRPQHHQDALGPGAGLLGGGLSSIQPNIHRAESALPHTHRAALRCPPTASN